MFRIRKTSIICAIIALITISICCVPLWLKKPIEDATYSELIEICGIGETRAALILKSGCTDVDNLYLIDGIGDKTVYILKKFYR